MVGLHVVTVGGADISCLVDSVSVNHGRDDAGSQPEASSATITLTAEAPNVLPAEVDVGALVRVTTQTAGGTWDRFAGRVSDLALGWDEAGAATPDMGVGQIVAVGALADLGRRVVGAAPFPQELDGARVARVMVEAGAPLDPLYSDPGTVDLLPRDIDAQQALNVAHDAAVSATGVLWQARTGQVRYADADHRRGTQPAVALDACDLLVTPTWRRTLEGLVNSVSIGYGTEPEGGGEAPQYVASNPDSISRYGTYAYSSSTHLAALADAQEQGQLLLVRNSAPVWVMAALPVDVAGLDAARYDALLALDMHSLLTLTGLPSIGAAPTSGTLWVEGWKEELTWGGHTLELVVSGYCRTTPPPRWDDVDPAWQWGALVLTQQRRNEIVDPNATNPANWSGVAAGGGITSAGPYSHNKSAVPGQVWSVSVELTAPAGGPALTGFVAAYPTSGGMFTVSPDTTTPFTIPAGQTQRVANSNAIPAGQNGVRLYVSASISNGTARLGRALMEQAPTAGAYFDGGTTDTASTDYAWAGTPNASASVQSAISQQSGGLPPDLTWDSATCLGPPINVGRWNDQPATLRWDQVAPAQTWDTYRIGA